MTRRLTIILTGMMLLALGVLGCGGDSEPAVPTLPPLDTPAPVSVQQTAVPAPSDAGQAQPDEALNRAIQPPQQAQGDPAPAQVPWPTFTPGPEPQSNHRLIYARTRRFYTANADGSDYQRLEFAPKSPQLLGLTFKDPGRGWLGPNAQALMYFAGPEAQLWHADLGSLENALLAERMIPVDKEDDSELIRILTQQRMAWASDGGRVALLGAPDNIDLFVVDLAADQIARLTQDDRRESSPQWSPDGRYLVYRATVVETSNQKLFVFDAQTQQSNEVELGAIRDAAEVSPDGIFAFSDPVWIDDTRLALYPRAGGREQSVGIWLYDVASGDLQPVVTDPINRVDWSPKARAWVYSKPDEQGVLWLVRLEERKPTMLVEGEAYAPLWSPDGDSVLYSWSDPEATGWDLRVVNVGGNSRTLAQDVSLIQPELSEPGPAGKRFWGPEGQWILYSAVGRDYGRAEREAGYGGEAGPDLENWFIVPASGGEARRATDMQKVFYLQDLTLSPDGTTWAYVGLSYTDRMQHLYTMPREGGHPERVDAGVRWFEWLP